MENIKSSVEETVNEQEFWGEGIEELAEDSKNYTEIRLKPREDKITIPRSVYDKLIADSVRLKIVQLSDVYQRPHDTVFQADEAESAGADRRRDQRILCPPAGKGSERHDLPAAPRAAAPCIQVSDEAQDNSEQSRRSGGQTKGAAVHRELLQRRRDQSLA